MLQLFPTPYPDETLHSLIGRYHILSGHISYRQTYLELFDSESIKLNRDLPGYLKKISSRIPGNSLNEEYLLYNHTLLPFYTAFKKRVERNSIKRLMMENNNKAGSAVGIIRAHRFQNHCPICIKTDFDKYGESYWHRVHQIPGIYICPVHNIPLMLVSKKDNGMQPYLFRVANFCKFEDSPLIRATDTKVLDILYKVAFEINCLLKKPEKTYLTVKNDLIRRLKYLNYYLSSERIDQTELQNNMTKYYSEAVLKILKSEIPRSGTNNWVSKIFRNNTNSHTLRYILLIIFLYGGLGEFQNENKNESIEMTSYFGEGPWPCLNPVHKEYKKDVITKIEVKKCSHTKKNRNFQM